MKRFFISLMIIGMAAIATGQETKKSSASIPQGYGSATWGSLVSTVRDNIKGKLVYSDEKSIIISKEGELQYTYGFFYVDPAVVQPATAEKAASDKPEQKTDEGKLFYVVLSFPYLSMPEVKKKYIDTFGEPTIENITENQGVIAWDDTNSIIVIWVDQYERSPFTRRITYVSKDITKEVNEYKYKMFNQTEIDVIKKLTP